MTKHRTLSLAAVLAAVTALSAPAFAIDLGGGIGGAIGGPSGIGGSLGGTISGTLDLATPRGDRLGRLNERAERVIDGVQDRSIGAIKVPDQPDAAALDAVMKAAGYGDAALSTPAGSASGSADVSTDGETPDASGVPALPDPAATANGAADRVQAVKTAAVKRAAAAVPSDPVSVSVSASGEAQADKSSDEGAASPEAAEPSPGRPASVSERNAPQS